MSRAGRGRSRRPAREGNNAAGGRRASLLGSDPRRRSERGVGLTRSLVVSLLTLVVSLLTLVVSLLTRLRADAGEGGTRDMREGHEGAAAGGRRSRRRRGSRLVEVSHLEDGAGLAVDEHGRVRLERRAGPARLELLEHDRGRVDAARLVGLMRRGRAAQGRPVFGARGRPVFDGGWVPRGSRVLRVSGVILTRAPTHTHVAL